MAKLTPYEIEKYIEDVYPQVKDLVESVGMTKDQWIQEAIRGPKKLFTRCENCKKWPCEHIENLKEKFAIFVRIWYEFGTACQDFSPKLLHNKDNIKGE